MATPKRPGTPPGDKTNDHTGLPPIELPKGVETAAAEVPLSRPRIPFAVIDFDHERLKGGWQKIIESQRKGIEVDVLRITTPRSKLDPIAKAALNGLATELLGQWFTGTDPATQTPQGLEREVHAFITQKGIASNVKKVTDRLNARRMTDGRRWVLATTYQLLLAKLFQERGKSRHGREQDRELEELMKDDLGVAEKIMLDLEAKGGPIDVFAGLIVKAVMDRNRIQPSKTLLKFVSQKVRAAI